jgi:hypothetical protein
MLRLLERPAGPKPASKAKMRTAVREGDESSLWGAQQKAHLINTERVTQQVALTKVDLVGY